MQTRFRWTNLLTVCRFGAESADSVRQQIRTNIYTEFLINGYIGFGLVRGSLGGVTVVPAGRAL